MDSTSNPISRLGTTIGAVFTNAKPKQKDVKNDTVQVGGHRWTDQSGLKDENKNLGDLLRIKNAAKNCWEGLSHDLMSKPDSKQSDEISKQKEAGNDWISEAKNLYEAADKEFASRLDNVSAEMLNKVLEDKDPKLKETVLDKLSEKYPNMNPDQKAIVSDFLAKAYLDPKPSIKEKPLPSNLGNSAVLSIKISKPQVQETKNGLLGTITNLFKTKESSLNKTPNELKLTRGKTDPSTSALDGSGQAKEKNRLGDSRPTAPKPDTKLNASKSSPPNLISTAKELFSTNKDALSKFAGSKEGKKISESNAKDILNQINDAIKNGKAEIVDGNKQTTTLEVVLDKFLLNSDVKKLQISNPEFNARCEEVKTKALIMNLTPEKLTNAFLGVSNEDKALSEALQKDLSKQLGKPVEFETVFINNSKWIKVGPEALINKLLDQHQAVSTKLKEVPGNENAQKDLENIEKKLTAILNNSEEARAPSKLSAATLGRLQNTAGFSDQAKKIEAKDAKLAVKLESAPPLPLASKLEAEKAFNAGIRGIISSAKPENMNELVDKFAEDLRKMDISLMSSVHGSEYSDPDVLKGLRPDKEAQDIYSQQAPNLVKVPDHFNKLTGALLNAFLQTDIAPQNMSERVKMVAFTMNVQTKLIEKGDFLGALTLAGILGNPSISRVVNAMKKEPQKFDLDQQLLVQQDKNDKLMEAGGQFKNYKDHLAQNAGKFENPVKIVAMALVELDKAGENKNPYDHLSIVARIRDNYESPTANQNAELNFPFLSSVSNVRTLGEAQEDLYSLREKSTPKPPAT